MWSRTPGHAALAGGTEPVEVGPADHARGRAEGDRLHDVAAAADAAVAVDLGPVTDHVADPSDQVEGGGRAVELSTPVVRERDRVDADLDRELRVLDGLHALEDDRAVPFLAEPLDVRPGQARVELPVEELGEIDRRTSVVVVAADDVRELDRATAQKVQRPRRVAARRRESCRARASAESRIRGVRRVRGDRASRCRR